MKIMEQSLELMQSFCLELLRREDKQLTQLRKEAILVAFEVTSSNVIGLSGKPR